MKCFSLKNNRLYGIPACLLFCAEDTTLFDDEDVAASYKGFDEGSGSDATTRSDAEDTISFTSSLEETDREFVCPEEVVSYVCSGAGSLIRLFAPPELPFHEALIFVRGDDPGTELRGDPIVANLISDSFPLMIAEVTVPNTSLLPLFLTCIHNS